MTDAAAASSNNATPLQLSFGPAPKIRNSDGRLSPSIAIALRRTSL